MLFDKLKKKFSTIENIFIAILIISSITLSFGIAISNAVISAMSAFIVFLSIIVLILCWFRGV